MRVWAEINLDNLKHNLKEIKNRADGREILGIVKANAYGHGAIEVATELSESDIKFFGVACVDEAEELLNHKIDGDILILGCTPIEEWKRAVSLGIQLALSSFEEIEYIEKSKIYPKIHVKIDTGMGRIGFTPEKAKEAIKYIQDKKLADIVGIFTHFSVSDEDSEYTFMQKKLFEEVEKEFPEIKYKHISNSAGILNFNFEYNMVRPGIILYGIVPFKDEMLQKIFRPVMTLKTKITFIKNIEEESSISYGRSYIAKKGEIIATLPVGYADGVSRFLSNKGEVIIRGIRCKIAGRVCMDQMMICIPKELKDIKPGEEVTIFGEESSVEELAQKIGTISYEILTNINNRVPRMYIKNGKNIKIKSLLGRKTIDDEKYI
jgi:alanine racemase